MIAANRMMLRVFNLTIALNQLSAGLCQMRRAALKAIPGSQECYDNKFCGAPPGG